MVLLVAVALLGLAPLKPQVVEKVNGPLAGNVLRYAWTPDGRYLMYGAPRNTPGIDVFTSVRVSDGSEVVYDPYPGYFLGPAQVGEIVFLPDAELVGVKYSLINNFAFPPGSGSSALHVIEYATAARITVIQADLNDRRFLDDGRMLSRTSNTPYRGPTYMSAWSGRWNADAPLLRLSPPEQGDNSVSLVLPAPNAGVAVFGWRDTFWSLNDAQLFAMPIGGGTRVPLTPPPSGSHRTRVLAVHVRSSDELVLYLGDEAVSGLMELWVVPVDGSELPGRLNPPLAPGRMISSYPIVSPDEARVLFVSDAGAYDVHELWSADFGGGGSVRLSGPMVAGGDVGDAYHDDFWISPDSTRVVYLADQQVDGVSELYSAPLDGHAPAVRLHPALSGSEDALSPVHFTPDGRFVVFAIRVASGVALFAAPSDASGPPMALNAPFPAGGGVLTDPWEIRTTVAIGPGGRRVFFLGEQDVDGVVELYSAPLDGSAPPHKWSAPLVSGGDVVDFALRPGPGAVLYRADQDVDQRFELYLSKLSDSPPPRAGASGRAVRRARLTQGDGWESSSR